MATVLQQPKPKTNQQEQLLHTHIDLVYKIARHYSQMVTSHYEDLVQVGSIGLLNAIRRYDAKRNANFRTYASHLIASEIKHYLRDQVAIVRPPRDLQELLPKVRFAEQQLRHNYGREPTLEEVAKALGIATEKLTEVYTLETTAHTISLDQELSPHHESSISLLEQLEDKKYKSFQLSQEDRIFLSDSLSELKSQSQEIIDFAFYQDLTQTEIAKRLGISQMQVSRRLKGALTELWHTLNTRVTPW